MVNGKSLFSPEQVGVLALIAVAKGCLKRKRLSLRGENLLIKTRLNDFEHPVQYVSKSVRSGTLRARSDGLKFFTCVLSDQQCALLVEESCASVLQPYHVTSPSRASFRRQRGQCRPRFRGRVSSYKCIQLKAKQLWVRASPKSRLAWISLYTEWDLTLWSQSLMLRIGRYYLSMKGSDSFNINIYFGTRSDEVMLRSCPKTSLFLETETIQIRDVIAMRETPLVLTVTFISS